MMDYYITTATQNNVEDIYNIMIRASENQRKDLFITDGCTKDWISENISERGIGAVAIYDSKVIGYIIAQYKGSFQKEMKEYLKMSTVDISKMAYLASAAVLPEYQGIHIQRNLISCIENMMPLTVKSVSCLAHPENKPSVVNIIKAGYDFKTLVYHHDLPRYVMMKVK